MSALTVYGTKIPFRSQVLSPQVGPIVESDTGSYSYYCYTSRQDSIKRRVPQGIEKLFSVTGLSNYRQGYSDSTYSTQSKAARSWGASRDFVPVGVDWTLGYLSAEEYNAALSSLRQELKAQHVNLAQALAEYRQTASLFAETAKEVVSLWRALRLKKMPPNFRFTGLGLSLKKKDKAWANRWLKFQYGAMPLVADVQGSLRALEASRPALVVVNHKRVINRSQSKEVKLTGSAYPLNTVVKVSTEDTTYRWKAYGEVGNPTVGVLSSLGFTNVFSLAYELLPYSFVLDWFCNLGEVLSDFDSLSGYTRVSAVQTQKTRYRSSNGIGAEFFHDRWARAPYPITQSVSLQWKPSLSWKRIVSATALVRQQIR